MIRHVFISIFLGLALLFVACSTDLLDQKYNSKEQLAPLYKPDAEGVINDKDREYIVEAQMTNNASGVSNEGKTFRELRSQGIEIAAREKARADLDSVRSAIEADRRSGKLK